MLRQLEEMCVCEVLGHGEFESAGQYYIEIGLLAENPVEVRDELEGLVSGTDWEVGVYIDVDGPIYHLRR